MRIQTGDLHATPPKQKKFYQALYFQVLVGLATGILVGHFWPDVGAALEPLGDAFVKIVKMMIANPKLPVTSYSHASSQPIASSRAWNGPISASMVPPGHVGARGCLEYGDVIRGGRRGTWRRHRVQAATTEWVAAQHTS